MTYSQRKCNMPFQIVPWFTPKNDNLQSGNFIPRYIYIYIQPRETLPHVHKKPWARMLTATPFETTKILDSQNVHK